MRFGGEKRTQAMKRWKVILEVTDDPIGEEEAFDKDQIKEHVVSSDLPAGVRVEVMSVEEIEK